MQNSIPSGLLFQACQTSLPNTKSNKVPLFKTISHTWYDKVGHIVRQDKTTGESVLCRCVIKELEVVESYGVIVNVVFMEKGKRKKKKSTASLMYATNVLWMDKTIVTSSDEDDEDVNTIDTPPSLLGEFRLIGDTGTFNIQRPRIESSLRHTFTEVNMLYRLIHKI